MITIYATSDDAVVSELAILDVNYFRDIIAVFTCIGYNGVPNYINSPESDSVELVFICKFIDDRICIYYTQMHGWVLTKRANSSTQPHTILTRPGMIYIHYCSTLSDTFESVTYMYLGILG